MKVWTRFNVLQKTVQQNQEQQLDLWAFYPETWSVLKKATTKRKSWEVNGEDLGSNTEKQQMMKWKTEEWLPDSQLH